MDQEKTWLTVPEVAKHLRIPRSRAYELIQGGGLPAIPIHPSLAGRRKKGVGHRPVPR